MHQHKSIVLQFVQCINDRNLKGLAALTADEFTFTDALGRLHVWDREGAVRECWQGYFTPFPDYKTHVQQVLTGGEGVAIIGRTIGSHMPAEIEPAAPCCGLPGSAMDWRRNGASMPATSAATDETPCPFREAGLHTRMASLIR